MAEPTLERGSEGQPVTDLQRALTELDFKPGALDGKFGVYTDTAVKAFQNWASVDQDGVVGPQTWAKLDHADKTDPTVKKGDERVAVRGVQRRLIELDFGPIEIDGRFGDETEATVKLFQEKYALDADGIVGPQTWAVLNSPPVED